MPMLYSVLDIGTNTLRLLIGYTEKGKVVRVAIDRSITQLGKNLKKTGRLDSDSIRKSIRCIERFKATSEELGAQKIIAIGTSALREAENSLEFIEEVKRVSGINIDVISGEKEAQLTLQGVLNDITRLGRSASNPSFIIDIGGGSTEWILYDTPETRSQKSEFRIKNSKLKTQNSKPRMGSIPIGAVKLFETYIKHDPPALEEVQNMQDYISKIFLNSFDLSLITHHPSLSFVATGGTATTLAAIDMKMNEYDGDKIHMHRVLRPSLEAILQKFISMPFDKRRHITGLESERADVIIPGTLILLTVMEIINANEMMVSDYGLLEGLLMNIDMDIAL